MSTRASSRPSAHARRRSIRSTTTGLTPRQERLFNFVALLVAGLLVFGWVLAYLQIRETPAEQRAEYFDETHPELMEAQDEEVIPQPVPDEEPDLLEVTSTLADTILDLDSINLGYLNEAITRLTTPLGGYSGELRALFKMPGESASELAKDGVTVRYRSLDGALASAEPGKVPGEPGIYSVELDRRGTTSTIEDFHVIVLVPFSEKKNGRIGDYRLGTWPFEKGGKPKTPTYVNPKGFIRLTRANRTVPVSTHFEVGDFVTKGQNNVWPKYLVLNPKLIDKLELVIDGLEDRGVAVKNIHIMSGFRHPAYNAGGGNTSGRASLSRHQYGDASDIFMDNNGDNWTDDVTGDGKLTLRDAELIRDIVDEIERNYPSLVGGVGIYPACCGHGPMTHVDVRGYRARWYY